MSWPALVALCILAYVIVMLLFTAWLNSLVARGPGDRPLVAFLCWFFRSYCRLVHRARFEGMHHVPATSHPGAMIVIANHTSGLDPLLIQTATPFLIRWMMARDMMVPSLNWMWKISQVIPVDRDGRDSAALREAMRHLRNGGVLGIFPEGRIVEPPDEIRPFVSGVGLIVAKCRVPVLLAWVSGTPTEVDTFASIMHPSHSRVVFVDRIDFGEETDAEKITRSLRTRLAQASGWRLNDEPMPPLERGEEAAA
jgi:1-acyl-sn-glycerol-3-phosphate acyltransferase